VSQLINRRNALENRTAGLGRGWQSFLSFARLPTLAMTVQRKEQQGHRRAVVQGLPGKLVVDIDRSAILPIR
jgi:hypothetical protein